MVCISSLLFSYIRRPHRANQCDPPGSVSLMDYVIHVSTSRDSRTFWSLLSKPEPSAFEKLLLHCTNRRGILFHWYNPNSHAKPVFSLSFCRKGTCQKAEPKSNVVKNFASPSLERLSSIHGIGLRIFYCYRVQVTKVATKSKLPPFLFRHYYPASPRRFRGFYHVVFKQHFYFRSARLPICVVSFVSRPLCAERHLLPAQFRVLRSYSNRCPLYVSKIHLRSDIKRPAIFQNLPHLFSFLNVLSLAKPVCQILIHMTRGRSGKFEQLDKPSSVSDFIENNL